MIIPRVLFGIAVNRLNSAFFKVRKYEKTNDVKPAIKSVLALFAVEKMSKSYVRDRPLASFFPQKGLSVHHIY